MSRHIGEIANTIWANQNARTGLGLLTIAGGIGMFATGVLRAERTLLASQQPQDGKDKPKMNARINGALVTGGLAVTVVGIGVIPPESVS